MKTFNNNSYREIDIARSVLASKIEGIKALSNSLDESFINLVEAISNLKGKVIVSGMGKSGHIARKIAATLSSTGTSSFFVHPGEASHGDLGMISKQDLVILLSNSGETKELIDIINYTKRFAIPLASFTRKAKSSLSKASNLTIVLPEAPEALEFDAPTTSTTMMLALGDALALTLLEKKDFSRDDFQVFHPGGRLGASFVRVSDLMHVGEEIPFVYETDSITKVIEVITKKRLGCAAVLNKKDEMSGVITDGNLRRAITAGLLEKTAADAMTKDPITIKSNSLAVEALDLMNSKAITNLLVVEDNKKVKGVLHIHDCLKAGASPDLK